MSARKWLAAAAVTAGLAVPGFAADPVKPGTFGFSTLKPAADADAKAKREGWLKATGKFDAARFESVWSSHLKGAHSSVWRIGEPLLVTLAVTSEDLLYVAGYVGTTPTLPAPLPSRWPGSLAPPPRPACWYAGDEDVVP